MAPTLLVVSEFDPVLARAARNVPWLQVETATRTSVYQLLRHARVIFEKGALLGLQEMLAR
jgi:ribosomal protein L4